MRLLVRPSQKGWGSLEGITVADDVTIVLDEPGVVVFRSPKIGNDLFAAIQVDLDLNPRPGSDPSDYGYAVTSIN